MLFILGGGGYFAFNKFKQEVTNAIATPSPSPSSLDFLFNGTTSQATNSSGAGLTLPGPSPQKDQTNERPLTKVKKLQAFPGSLPEDTRKNKAVVIETTKGKIAIQIFPEVAQASSNFLILAANGFYDNLTFHRVEKDFVIQGGDPNGNGTGGPGYSFADEPVSKDYNKGIVAMANAGPNTNGSQFFIMLKDHPELPKNYTIFGQVIAGMEAVEKITVGDVMQKVTVQNIQ